MIQIKGSYPKNYRRYQMDTMDLQIFAEGGDGGATGAAAGAEVGQAAENTSQVAAGSKKTSGKGNPLANVKYGIQDPEGAEIDAAGAEGTPSNAEIQEPDRNAEFDKLIKGDYKEQFDARVQDILARRFKSQEALAERQKQLDPILGMLADKYGVERNGQELDYAKLEKAICDDDSYYEQEALEKGVPVATLKELKRMERENTRMKEAMEERQRQDRNHRAYEALLQQADETKKVYPGFNLKTEMQNPDFSRLIAANVDAKTAYEVVHKDEIQPAMAQYMVQRTADKISKSIQAGQKRPTEAGASSQSAAVSKTDVSKLTKADREEIMRRVAMGERIRF